MAALTASLALGSAQAEIVWGDGTAAGVAAGTRSELLLMVWDWDKKVSYTKDLGILAYTESLAAGDPTKNLFVYGQQDTGYQKIFDPLNTDPNFVKFLQNSPDRTKQVWAIAGGSTNNDLAVEPGWQFGFMTSRHVAPTGQVDADYLLLTNWTGEQFIQDFGSFIYYQGDLNNGNSGVNAAFNTHKTSANGSSFNANPEAGYVGSYFINGPTGPLGAGPKLFNAVGDSSWFYAVSYGSLNASDPVNVDEFDNLKHDAYWGLGVDSSGNYILSYTLEGALTQATTFAGGLLRLKTDYAASYGATRLIAAPAGDAALIDPTGLNTVTAVPEPATWGLMGLGLIGVVGAARRRRHSHAS